MSVPSKLLAALLLAAILLATGYWLGHRAATPPRENTAPAPVVVQADGSVIAERAPQATASAPHQIPKGATVERQASVTVKPRPAARLRLPAQQSAPAALDDAAACECEPITVDLSLIRQGDGRRLIASSADGEILRAIDVPIESAILPPPARPWGVGLSCSVGDNCALRTAGVIVQRDWPRVRAGAEIYRQPDGKPATRAHVIWRF